MIIVLTIIMCKKTSDAQCNCSPPADRCPAYSRAAGPPTPASHPYILFSMTSDGMEYPFWPVWVSCPGSVPSRLLLHP